MPVSLDATADVRAGVALVTARVSNPAPVDRRVRLDNRLDGPVLPPRRHGVPAAGWSDGGFEGVVPAGGTLALGYACPVGEGVTAERPLELADVGAPEEATEPPVERARRLAPSRPPRDAVPVPGTKPEAVPAPDPAAPEDTAATASGPGTISTPEGSSDAPAVPDEDRSDASPADTSDASADPSPAVPDPVDAYLDAVEGRVVRGERLTGASLAEATAALSETDAGTPVADLPEALAADAEALETLSERAERLAERARATDVPVAALRRLA